MRYRNYLGRSAQRNWIDAGISRHAHDRYAHFLPCGDATAYREQIDKVRDDFKDLKGR